MKELCKHEKVAVSLFTISILLMGVSFWHGVLDEAISILQGLSTGLLSGMVVLLVTGIREREIRELSDLYDFYYKNNNAFVDIMESYNCLFHKTYHGKKEKMPFKTYADLIDETFNKFDLACLELISLNRSLKQKDCITKDILELARSLDADLSDIQRKIDIAKADGKDRVFLNEICEMFFDMQYKVTCFYPKSLSKMQQIYEIRKRTESSYL